MCSRPPAARGAPPSCQDQGRHVSGLGGGGILFPTSLLPACLPCHSPRGPVEETLPEKGWDFPLDTEPDGSLSDTPHSFSESCPISQITCLTSSQGVPLPHHPIAGAPSTHPGTEDNK